MSSLTVAEFKEHFETDLADTAIQRAIDSVEEEIAQIVGPTGAASYVLNGGEQYLFLPSPIESIAAVQETVYDTATILALNDYRLVDGGYYVQRRYDGTNPRYRWGTLVDIDVVHPSNSSKVQMVTIDLVKIELQYNGVATESKGGFSYTMHTWAYDRAHLLRGLRAGLPLV